MALGKDFLFFFKNSLPRATGQALVKEPSAIFFLVFLAQFFCGATIHCFELNFKIQANFDFVLYISLIYFDSSIFFEYVKFELQVHGILQCSVSKNVIHVNWCMLSPYP